MNDSSKRDLNLVSRQIKKENDKEEKKHLNSNQPNKKKSYDYIQKYREKIERQNSTFN